MAALLFAPAWQARAGHILSTSRQTYASFTTLTPLPEGDTLVIGFLGGWEKWDDPNRGVRKFALRLRSMNLTGVHVETVENHRRELALELVRRALDRNHDGRLDEWERQSARIILYGQSFGAAAVNKLSRELNQRSVPVLLIVQVDSVGLGDGLVPANVRRAMNLFQKNDCFMIRGEDDFRAEDSTKTQILGNERWNYAGKTVNLAGAHWYQKLFRNAHVKMELDPEVWSIVETIILRELRPPAIVRGP